MGTEHSRIFIQKQARQVKELWAIIPPTDGPTTVATENTLPTRLTKKGSLRADTIKAAMVKTPEKMPAEPQPWRHRPRMRIAELGAPAQTADPTAKRLMAPQKTIFRGKKVYSCPYVGWKAVFPTAYAAPYQTTSSSL